MAPVPPKRSRPLGPDPALLTLPLKILPDPLAIPTLGRPFSLAITPPGSKSLTNRAILLAALGRGDSLIRNPLLGADDTERMLEAVTQLGAKVDRPDDGLLRITGVAGRWRPAASHVTLNLQNAGTATRFLAAAAILGNPADGPITIDGNERMRERPIAELGDALRQLGVRVEYPGRAGHPPIRIHPPDSLFDIDSEITFGRTASSQFISALLLIAPWLPKGLRIRFSETPTSESYIWMTTGLLRRCGFQVRGDIFDAQHTQPRAEPPPAPPPAQPAAEAPTGRRNRLTTPEPDPDEPSAPAASGPAPDSHEPEPTPASEDLPGPDEPAIALLPPGPVTVSPAPYLVSSDRLAPAGIDIAIEPDASSATYFLAAAAISPRAACVIRALPRPSLQPDAAFAEILKATGADAAQSPRGTGVRNRQYPLEPFAYDFAHMPDAAITAAVVACFAEGCSILWGVQTLRVKECDRIHALQTELAKVGVTITAERPARMGDQELLVISPPPGGIDLSPGLPPVEFDTYDDHRIAMALALIGLRRPNVSIRNPACVAKTYPGFWRDFARVYNR